MPNAMSDSFDRFQYEEAKSMTKEQAEMIVENVLDYLIEIANKVHLTYKGSSIDIDDLEIVRVYDVNGDWIYNDDCELIKEGE